MGLFSNFTLVEFCTNRGPGEYARLETQYVNVLKYSMHEGGDMPAKKFEAQKEGYNTKKKYWGKISFEP